MRTGKDLVLATKPYAVDHPLRSWWCILSTGILLLAALAGAFVEFHPAVRLACSVAAGLLVLRFFVIYHDQQHHAILPRSRVAEGIMRVFGVLSLSPSSVWRSSHNHHHNHNSKLRGSHIGSFPIMTREQYEKTPRSRRVQYLFMRHPLTILFGYVFVFLWGMCLFPFINEPRKHFDSLVALVLHLVIGAALFWSFGWQTLLFVQTIPHFVACAIGSYLFYAQHNFPAVAFKHSGGWTYEGAALESSSFMRTGPIMAWITGNIGYHHLHHLNSKIPFYRLPEAMRAIPELQQPKVTSLNPAEILRCLRLKVWDVEAQRMVGLRDV
ncbi:MAG: fatty acid desaturase family protein [Limisphaerales bacterium]